ncbi:DUF2975 domain-containing protein [Algoriphagus sp. C2-6-M1]|uniref:DUF2975 domain-containing protein n=1 Tax=Algoriphagus persicinus TaxID=3108754 RepID=UPI002B3EB6A9|nr:DUF2975 domain-containing protein [Algoriphagus sp. C2-6-M1]MEB2782911.1 DUF2975 domain-containing protein [Algoriphagus sp. C2-6-M1]
MEIKITTNHTLLVLQLLSWIIFIGLCIDAGGIIVHTIITLFINHGGVKNFWEGADYLSSIYDFDKGYFIVITLVMSIVAILKSTMFYLIVKLFSEKTLDFQKPFSMELRGFILNLSYLSLGIGLFSHAGFKYSDWLTAQGLSPSADMNSLHISGSDVWIFIAVILMVIAQIVKRGVEIQSENDLTV